MTDRRWPAWSALIAAVVLAWFAIQAQQPPSPLPADASAVLFAAGRAQKHVEAIARARTRWGPTSLFGCAKRSSGD